MLERRCPLISVLSCDSKGCSTMMTQLYHCHLDNSHCVGSNNYANNVLNWLYSYTFALSCCRLEQLLNTCVVVHQLVCIVIFTYQI